MNRAYFKFVSAFAMTLLTASLARGQDQIFNSVQFPTLMTSAGRFDIQTCSQTGGCTSTGPMSGVTGLPLESPQAIDQNASSYDPSSQLGAFGAGQGALTGQNTVAAAVSPGGYLDVAAPVTQFRLRYDDALNNKYPDRGEYFYAKCGCFRDAKLDPNAKGPSGINDSVNVQDLRAYSEYAFSPRVSVFAEVPLEWIHFQTGAGDGKGTTSPGNSAGLGDINAGFKYAFIARPDEYLTFQFRTYIPTGDSYQGLGTAHVSLEPSLLYYRRMSDRWILQGQFSEFTPIGGSNFASDVLQYGAGVGYILVRGQRFVVTPTVETVGWTFLGGYKFNPQDGGQRSASGDTIVNIKPGVRVGFGDVNAPAGQQRQSLYVGWGHAVTSQQFYADIFRMEYRVLF